MSTTTKVIEEIKDLLNEEKWTRQTIDNYTKKDFVKLDDIIEKSFAENYAEELREECINHLKSSSRSIIALYIAGIISLEEDLVDDTYIYQVIQLFQNNDKYALVEFLAEKVLEYGENKIALEVLKDCYEYEENEEELVKIWERLVRIDHQNGEIPKLLAEKNENEGNLDISIHYYKTAIRRYIKNGNLAQTENLWRKLVDMIPDDIDFFYSIEKDIAKKSPEKASELLTLLSDYYTNKNNIDRAIEILKKIMVYTNQNKEARNKIVECLSIKYKNHSQLDKYIKISKINQTWKNFQDALDEFQKHIAFDVGNIVFHKSWKIGRIVKIEEENFTIDFETKKNHTMTLQMALKSLEVLPEDHIWIVKRQERDKLRDDSEEAIKFVLQTILKSFNNQASLKDIKREMTEGVIPVKDWNKWWAKAKKIIKKEPIFGSSYETKDHYFLDEKLLSFEDETYTKFSIIKSFQDKLEVMEDYIKHSEDYNNENFIKMVQYFADIANDKDHITEKTVQSYLLLRKIKKMHVPVDLKISPIDIATNISNYSRVFEDLPDTETKKELIELLRRNHPNWQKNCN